jgi:hypothetical protein
MSNAVMMRCERGMMSGISFAAEAVPGFRIQ